MLEFTRHLKRTAKAVTGAFDGGQLFKCSTGEINLAGSLARETAQDGKQSTFASAIRADHAVQARQTHFHGHAVEYLEVAIGQVQSGSGEHTHVALLLPNRPCGRQRMNRISSTPMTPSWKLAMPASVTPGM